METTVVPEDIANALARPAPDPNSPQELQYWTWIGEAQFWLNRSQAVQDRFASGLVTQGDIDYVVRSAVVAYARAWNPTNAKRSSVAIDDGRVEREYLDPVAELTISDALWAVLLPDEASSSGAFSIRLGYSPDSCGDLISWRVRL